MYKSKYLIFGKRSIIIFSIFISLLFISSVTAVPQSNGSLAIDKIDDLNQNQKILELIENFNKRNHKSITNKDLYLFTKIIKLEIITIGNEFNNENSINSILVQKENNIIKNEDIIMETKNCITSLSSSIENIKNDYKSNNIEFDSLNILEKYLLKIDNAFTNNFYNNNDIIKDEYLQLNNGVFQNIISLFLTIIQFIITLLKALLQGFFTVFAGLIKTIGALIGIIILIIADIQTILLLTGLYIISIGILSRNIIKTLASIGAPIFAAISAFLSIAIGSLLGSIVTIGFSIIGVAIILAIPIALIAGFLYFSGYFDNGDGDGLLYIITSSFAYYLKSI
jgi:hypothetical protein